MTASAYNTLMMSLENHREDANKYNLRGAAYEALMEMVKNSPKVAICASVLILALLMHTHYMNICDVSIITFIKLLPTRTATRQ